MKLIIDITEDRYKWIKEHKGFSDFKTTESLYNSVINAVRLDYIKAEINEEKEFAYADFEQYKVDYLGIDREYVCDELPNDDFRYGMERALEIINKHTKGNKQGVLEQIAEEQKTLSDTTRAWSDYIEKHGDIY